ncbi:hypothetical protein AAHA92_34050 [Salvia divinorum]|uniref:Uncharacterized protein n=1 Tax=Salvia divinorum TaxID=28513 RepID=A0ABD1FHQ5_SALDI
MASLVRDAGRLVSHTSPWAPPPPPCGLQPHHPTAVTSHHSSASLVAGDCGQWRYWRGSGGGQGRRHCGLNGVVHGAENALLGRGMSEVSG